MKSQSQNQINTTDKIFTSHCIVCSKYRKNSPQPNFIIVFLTVPCPTLCIFYSVILFIFEMCVTFDIITLRMSQHPIRIGLT